MEGYHHTQFRWNNINSTMCLCTSCLTPYTAQWEERFHHVVIFLVLCMTGSFVKSHCEVSPTYQWVEFTSFQVLIGCLCYAVVVWQLCKSDAPPFWKTLLDVLWADNFCKCSCLLHHFGHMRRSYVAYNMSYVNLWYMLFVTYVIKYRIFVDNTTQLDFQFQMLFIIDKIRQLQAYILLSLTCLI